MQCYVMQCKPGMVVNELYISTMIGIRTCMCISIGVYQGRYSSYVHMYILKQMSIYTCNYKCRHRHRHRHMHTHMYMNARALTCTYAYTCECTYKYSHTHMQYLHTREGIRTAAPSRLHILLASGAILGIHSNGVHSNSCRSIRSHFKDVGFECVQVSGCHYASIRCIAVHFVNCDDVTQFVDRMLYMCIDRTAPTLYW